MNKIFEIIEEFYLSDSESIEEDESDYFSSED